MAAASSPGEKREVKLTCDDILEFQESLKKMRMIDDRIIYKLNTTVPTDSFSREVNASKQCEQLYKELESSYTGREKAIKKCISQVSDEVNTLKLKRENDMNNIELMKSLRKEQAHLRLMRTEVNVEEVIKDRSLKVFYERCRQLYKPSSSHLS